MREQARNKYRNLSEEDKNNKKNMEKKYHNVPEEKKQRLKEYQKNFCGGKKVSL